MTYRAIEGAESIGFSLDVLESPPPDMVCPSVPYHGVNNFWSSSCKIKQQMKEHKLTCYPHCKKQNYKAEVGGSNPEMLEKRRLKSEELRASIVALTKAGHDVLDIMKTLEIKAVATVYKHLRFAGVAPVNTKRVRQNKKSEVIKLLAKDETLTAQQLVNIVGTIQVKSAQLYIDEYKRNKSKPNAKDVAFELLRQKPHTTAKEIARITGCTQRTAKDYKNKFGKVA